MFPSFSSPCLRTNVSRFGYVAFFLGARVPHSLVSGLFFCSALGLVFPTVSLYAFGARDPRSGSTFSSLLALGARVLQLL